MSDNTEQQGNPRLEIGLALIGGLGFTIMTLALAVGVIQGEAASTDLIGISFFTGLVLLIGGSAGWYGVTLPHKHFDDINVPEYTGHHHEEETH